MTGTLDTSAATFLLCDADGTLFPSEEPAYAASAGVTNRFLGHLGGQREYSPAELQGMTNGKNFRGAAQELAAGYGRELTRADLDGWVAEEKDAVTAHLRTVLGPDPEVQEPLTRLADRYTLAVVTSSASSRLDACLEVTTARVKRSASRARGCCTSGSGRSTSRRWAVTTSFSSVTQLSRSARVSSRP